MIGMKLGIKTMAETMTRTAVWEQKLRKAGNVFARIQTYEALYDKVAILRINGEMVTFQYPKLEVVTVPFFQPLGDLRVSRVKFETKTIRYDLDTTIQELN